MGVEEELALQCGLDVLRSAKTVLLSLEWHIGVRHAPPGESGHHRLGLVRRHDQILETLEEDDRAGDPLGV